MSSAISVRNLRPGYTIKAYGSLSSSLRPNFENIPIDFALFGGLKPQLQFLHDSDSCITHYTQLPTVLKNNFTSLSKFRKYPFNVNMKLDCCIYEHFIIRALLV